LPRVLTQRGGQQTPRAGASRLRLFPLGSAGAAFFSLPLVGGWSGVGPRGRCASKIHNPNPHLDEMPRPGNPLVPTSRPRVSLNPRPTTSAPAAESKSFQPTVTSAPNPAPKFRPPPRPRSNRGATGHTRVMEEALSFAHSPWVENGNTVRLASEDYIFIHTNAAAETPERIH